MYGDCLASCTFVATKLLSGALAQKFTCQQSWENARNSHFYIMTWIREH